MAWYNSFKDLTGDIGGAAKGIGHVAGDVLSNPLVDAGLAFIPGVGPVAAGIAGAAGGLLKPGGNLGSALKGGLEGAASGASGNLLKGALGLGSVGAGAAGAAESAAAPSAISALGASSAIPDAATGLGSASGAAGAAGAGGGLLGSIGSFLTGNGGKNALGIAQGINAALNQKQSTDYAKQALGSVEAAYNAKAPLRAQGLSILANSQTGNPYATGTPNAALRPGGY